MQVKFKYVPGRRTKKMRRFSAASLLHEQAADS